MKLNIFTQQGKKATKQAEVSDAVFGTEVNKDLLSQYVYVYLSNQREAIAHTKDRSEVSGGGRKPWAQKGTGRARAGSNRSPIWTKGGVTFGPTNRRNWKKTMPRKMKKLAMCSALSSVVADSKLKVVSDLKFSGEQLAKQGLEMIKALDLGKKALIVTGSKNKDVMNAFSNIPRVKVLPISEINAYDVLYAGSVVMTEDALEYTNNWIVSNSNESN